MPRFLEDKLKREYPNNPHAAYGTMNRIGAMHGNQETDKGREMQAKHDADVKAGQTLRPKPRTPIRVPKGPDSAYYRSHGLMPAIPRGEVPETKSKFRYKGASEK